MAVLVYFTSALMGPLAKTAFLDRHELGRHSLVIVDLIGSIWAIELGGILFSLSFSYDTIRNQYVPTTSYNSSHSEICDLGSEISAREMMSWP